MNVKYRATRITQQNINLMCAAKSAKDSLQTFNDVNRNFGKLISNRPLHYNIVSNKTPRLPNSVDISYCIYSSLQRCLSTNGILQIRNDWKEVLAPRLETPP